MNWTILFIIISGIAALVAATLQYFENGRITSENKRLQKEVLNFTRGGDSSMPALLNKVFLNKITFTILSNDDYPMFNVRVKCDEQQLQDIGTVYPKVSTDFYTVIVPSNADTVMYNFVIWYNNRFSIQAEIHFQKRQADGFFEVTQLTYFDKNQKPFKHPWQPDPTVKP